MQIGITTYQYKHSRMPKAKQQSVGKNAEQSTRSNKCSLFGNQLGTFSSIKCDLFLTSDPPIPLLVM